MILSRILMMLFVLLMAAPASSAEYAGKVIGITDGDTLTLLTPDKQQIKVRLAEIDTPESGQPFGNKAKDALSALAFGNQARVAVVDRDRYGRIVGRVYVGDTDVNAQLVREGAAWVYRQYARDPVLLVLEEEARQASRGLWALPEAQITPPWEWRQAGGRTVQQPVARSMVADSGGFSCGGKRYCKQMTSCAEARFYLEQCGLSRLDGDGDGVPC